ncbi:MAG TPA: NADP oxidoreductase [bacterium]|nr:NADP oxidoreductase [bacterium]HQO36729.1 NADP oxidoreductase [bacterium]HQP99992.1 NADP oxidoreductase [bacterium]
MSKVRVATVWLGGCSGCHMSFLDMDEHLIDLAEKIEITSSPITDVKEIPEVTVGIVEGTVCNNENIETLKDLRSKCKILVAIGDCAAYGGISSMRNWFPTEEVLRRAYVETESMVLGDIPDDKILPKLIERAKPVQEIVKVDAYIPGCPPSGDEIYYAITELLAGRIPVWEEGRIHYD